MEDDTPIWMQAIFDLPPEKQLALYAELFKLCTVTWKLVPRESTD